MYRKHLLEAELCRENISREELSRALGISLGTLSKKINQKTPFTLPELQKIADLIGAENVQAIFFAQ